MASDHVQQTPPLRHYHTGWKAGGDEIVLKRNLKWNSEIFGAKSRCRITSSKFIAKSVSVIKREEEAYHFSGGFRDTILLTSLSTSQIYIST